MIEVTNLSDVLEKLRWNDQGLIPAIVQSVDSGEVLMMAWMNRDALMQTLELGEAVFWSRSRGEIWHKGTTSGNVQRVLEVRVDCDADVLLLEVVPAGPACHTGETACFFRTIDEFSTTDTPYA